MDHTKTLNILQIVLTWLLRLMLTAAALMGLCVLALALVLNLAFNGPSQTARDQLTMTLLESERTCDIPGRFLDQETISHISGGAVSPTGTSDPSLIQPSPAGELRTVIHTLDGFTAQVLIIPAGAQVQLVNHAQDAHEAPMDSHVILAADLWNGQRYAGLRSDGILMLSDDPQAIDGGVRCGHVLIRDGHVNEALFAGCSGFAPRAAIGQMADGSILFITTDGWTREHLGATYQDMINLMTHYNAVNACLLDPEAVHSIRQLEAVNQKEG